MKNRWWIYQRERFPLFQFGAFIAAVCFAVLVFSALLRGASIDPRSFLVAFVCTMLFFLQLRVADEFKDYDDDAAARPYRPVQRGLVTLSELRAIALAGVIVQITIVTWLSPWLLIPLAVVLAYLGLMTKEFFVGGWLRRRPVAYLTSHQVILPLIYFFIAACDWIPGGTSMPAGIIWVLGMGYFSGIVVEIGRKLRAPEDEEAGVETYSSLWGWKSALVVWLAVVAIDAALAAGAARQIGIGVWVAIVSLVLLCGALETARRFARRPEPGMGRRIELMAGLWTVILHGSFGIALLL